jgi:glycosyltransferase involved in cell wall biosynthesis
LKVLVLSELFYPQGGGAEKATHLYLNELIRNEYTITLFTNKDVSINDNNNLKLVTFNLGQKNINKLSLSTYNIYIKRKLSEIVKNHDIIYVPGKLLVTVPFLKRNNPAAKIYVHLHDYQLICPHASLYNFIHNTRCGYIWDKKICQECIFNYESITRDSYLKAYIGIIGKRIWRHAYGIDNISNVIKNTDTFITVSKKQAELISNRLSWLSNEFLEKNRTIYNPINTENTYIPLSNGDKINLTSFSGDRYLKGYRKLIKSMEKLKNNGNNHYFLNILGNIVRKKQKLSCNNIRLFGYLNPQQVYNIYRNTYLVLLMSIWDEPLPYIVAEAQLRGRPVLSTNVGGVAEEIVKPGFTGEIVNKNNESFIDTIQRYSEKMKEKPIEMGHRIAEKSKIFFQERTKNAYEDFKNLMEK